jgi:hypothetical protein
MNQETTMIKTPKSLRQMAIDACEKFTDNRKAMGDIHACLKNDPKLQADLKEEILRMAVAAAVEDARSNLRQGAKCALQTYYVPKPTGQTPRSTATYAANRGVMMGVALTSGHLHQTSREFQAKINGWVIGKIKLMDATREQLLAAAKQDRASAVGLLQNAEFYEELASRLTGKKRVRDILTQVDAAIMWQRITRSTKAAA